MAWDAIIGAGLSAAGSLGSQALANAGSAKAAEEAGKQAIELWKMQAAYNTPANQVARLRAAGLNPNLIYDNGSANTGNMSSPPAMTEPARKNWDFNQVINAMTAAANLRNINQQNKNLQAQTDSINAETALKDKNTELREKEIELKSRELDILSRTGMRPGIGSAIVSFGDAVARGLTGNDFSPLERAKNVGRSIGNAISAGLPTLSGYEPFDGSRGRAMANAAANKRGLTGKERDAYIDKFMMFYRKTH